MTDLELIAILDKDFTNVGLLAALHEITGPSGLDRAWRIYYVTRYGRRWEAIVDLYTWADWVYLHADSGEERHAALYYRILLLEQATDAELLAMSSAGTHRGTGTQSVPLHLRTEIRGVLDRRLEKRRRVWIGVILGAALGIGASLAFSLSR